MTRARSDFQRRGRDTQRAAYARNHGQGEDVTITGVKFGKETEKAILVTIGDTDHWLPLSQVRSITRSPEPQKNAIKISAWIAKEKGLA